MALVTMSPPPPRLTTSSDSPKTIHSSFTTSSRRRIVGLASSHHAGIALTPRLSRTSTNSNTTSYNDTPSKVPVLTPSRTLHKARSLSNLAQENRSPEPMDLSTPYKQHPYRASVSSPSDLRGKLEAAQRQTARMSLNPARPPLHHAATTIEATQPTRPQITSTHSFSYLGTPAKWSANDPDAPSPFIKRDPAPPPPPPPQANSNDDRQPRGNYLKRPSAGGPSDLRRLATMANARGATTGRSTERIVQECVSPLRSRAALAQQDAMRAMGSN